MMPSNFFQSKISVFFSFLCFFFRFSFFLIYSLIESKAKKKKKARVVDIRTRCIKMELYTFLTMILFLIGLHCATEHVTSTSLTEPTSYRRKTPIHSHWGISRQRLRRNLFPDEEVPEACSQLSRSDSQVDRLTKPEQPDTHNLDSEWDTGTEGSAAKPVVQAEYEMKNTEGLVGVDGEIEVGQDSKVFKKNKKRKDKDVKELNPQDDDRAFKRNRDLDPQQTEAAPLFAWANPLLLKDQRNVNLPVLDRFYKSWSEHLQALVHHEDIATRYNADGSMRRSSIPKLLSNLDTEGIKNNVSVDEPMRSLSSYVTLSEIQNRGRYKWFRDQKVWNAWRTVGEGVVNERLMMIVGEVLQVWSRSVNESMKTWNPEFLTVREGSRGLEEVRLGSTKWTRSLALKNKKMLIQAIADTNPEVFRIAVGWYRDLMGDEKFDERIAYFETEATNAERAIERRLISKFYQSYFTTDSKSLNSYVQLYKEVLMAYPDLLSNALSEIREKDDAQVVSQIESKLAIDINRAIDSEHVSKSLKMTQPYPIWSYRQAAEIIEAKSDQEKEVYEEYRSVQSYRARLAQIEATPEKITQDLVEIVKKLVGRDTSLSTHLELQWLSETMQSLPADFQKKILDEVEDRIAIDHSTFQNLLIQAHKDAREQMIQKMEEIFLEHKSLSSCEALDLLFTLERIKACPKFWNEYSSWLRYRTRYINTLSFDQKYEWLQQRSQPAITTLLIKAYKNLNSLLEQPSPLSVTLELHLLIEKINSMYENHVPLKELIWEEVYPEISVIDRIRVDKAIESALRQNWTRETWKLFLKEKLGYTKGDPVFNHVHALGICLQFNKEYPTFLGDQLQEAYDQFLEIPEAIKQTTQKILGIDYDERVDLLKILSILSKARSPDNHIMASVLSYVDHDRISEWLHQGISAPSMIVGTAALGLDQRHYDLSETTQAITELGFSDRLTEFIEALYNETSLEYEALLQLSASRPDPRTVRELNERIKDMRAYLVGFLSLENWCLTLQFGFDAKTDSFIYFCKQNCVFVCG